MPPKTDSKLDLKLPAAILEFGQMVAASHAGIRVSPRTSPAADPQRLADVEDRLLAMVKADATARKAMGIRAAGQGESEARVRLRAVALVAFRTLGQPASQPVSELSDVAWACADHKLPPGEAIIRARDVIGRMVAEDVVVGGGDADGLCEKIRLPPFALQFLAGGRSSMAFLTMSRLMGMLLPRGPDQPDDEPLAPPLKIPSAKELRGRIAEHVIGLDAQVAALSGLLVMHLARAKMLREGRDPGTANIAILLASSPGTGKTWLMQTAGRMAGCPFASVSATSMTSEGYVGGKLDDLFRALVAKAKGDLNAARFGIAFADEWDSKAMRGGRDVTTLALQQEILVPMQGAEFLISGKRAMERQVTFNSVGTFFAFAGAFPGLRELIRKRTTRSYIGFSDGMRTRRQEYVLDAIREYGYLRAWTSRLGAAIFLEDPRIDSLEKAAAGAVLDSFNALVGELGMVLFPHGDSIARMAGYALESRTFFRGLKSVWWSIAAQAVAAGEKGTILVGGAEVDAAIVRVASGAADAAEANVQSVPSGPFDVGTEAGVEGDGA